MLIIINKRCLDFLLKNKNFFFSISIVLLGNFQISEFYLLKKNETCKKCLLKERKLLAKISRFNMRKYNKSTDFGQCKKYIILIIITKSNKIGK